MDPRIQYARTVDGVSVAYFSLGSGVPLVQMGVVFDDVLASSRSEASDWCAAISGAMQLVRYDTRGFGMSSREIDRYTVETSIDDLDAVVQALALRKFVLVAGSSAGPPGIRYAAEHPDRVSALILHDSSARMRDVWNPRVQSMHAMLTAAPDLYFRTIADLAFGHGTPEAESWANHMLNSTDASIGRLVMESVFRWDETASAATVRVPTLVVHTYETLVPIESQKSLAAMIPGAELALVPVQSKRDLVDGLWRTIRRFLAARNIIVEGEESTGGQGSLAFRTILFTDLVGHTEMMSRLGDDAGRAVLREHEQITREVLKQYGGTEVKTLGDGFMASFGSVTKAVECAIGIQRAFAERDGEPLNVRVGLNAGEPIEEDGDLFGATVILASRIAAKAGAGEILVADTVRGLCSGKGFLFADRGEFVAKGFEEPVRVYEVSWRS
jgi:class 3 adenylate cyclase